MALVVDIMGDMKTLLEALFGVAVIAAIAATALVLLWELIKWNPLG